MRVRLFAAMLVALAWAGACTRFDDLYTDCVAEGRCADAPGQDGGADGDAGSSEDASVDAGEPDSGVDPIDGGADAGMDASVDAGSDAGSDGGCTPGPVPAACADAFCEVFAIDGGSMAGVHGFSPTDVWVAGTGIAAHWDGCAWTQHALSGDPFIWSIWGANPQQVWFVGEKMVSNVRQQAVRRWNGNGFSSYDPASSGALYGVSGSGAADVWMTGLRQGTTVVNTIVQHWAGAQLRQYSQFELWSASSYLFDVQTVGQGLSVFVGAFGEITSGPDGGWKPSAQTGVHYSVWGTSPRDLWVVGEGGRIYSSSAPDGGWTLHPAVTGEHLYQVHGTGANNVWMVGANGTVVHHDGGSFAVSSLPPYSAFNGVWVGGPDEVWITTDDGRVLHNRR